MWHAPPSRRGALALAALLLFAGCEDRTSRGGSSARDVDAEAGSGSLDGPVDPSLAARGERVFRSRGCIACHKVGGDPVVGPDLRNVTVRRELPWIRAMILRPDSMLRSDSTARALLEEYFTPMTDMGVTAEEATALIHYLRSRADTADANRSES